MQGSPRGAASTGVARELKSTRVPLAARGRRQPRSMRAIGGENAEACQVDPRLRHQGDEPGDDVHGRTNVAGGIRITWCID